MDGGGGLDADPALDALRDVLAALSATAPRLVFQKTLGRSDVDPNQARLLIPCRKCRQPGIADDAADALAAFLTADEKDSVNLEGMQVPAFDRHGRRFDMRLRMLQANRTYRVLGPEWRRFVRDNQLEEAVPVENEMGRTPEVQLWAFRSVELLPLENRMENGGHHPDGALEIAILIRKPIKLHIARVYVVGCGNFRTN